MRMEIRYHVASLLDLHFGIVLPQIAQNFEDWDDVGLNISKPLGLLHFFRHYTNFSLTDQEHIARIRELVNSSALEITR